MGSISAPAETNMEAPACDTLPITPTPTPAPNPPQTSHQHIWLVTGPAGCGKSTVGQYIAKAMNFPFIEGDLVYPFSSPLNHLIIFILP